MMMVPRWAVACMRYSGGVKNKEDRPGASSHRSSPSSPAWPPGPRCTRPRPCSLYTGCICLSVYFKMPPQSASPRGYKVTLVAFV